MAASVAIRISRSSGSCWDCYNLSRQQWVAIDLPVLQDFIDPGLFGLRAWHLRAWTTSKYIKYISNMITSMPAWTDLGKLSNLVDTQTLRKAATAAKVPVSDVPNAWRYLVVVQVGRLRPGQNQRGLLKMWGSLCFLCAFWSVECQGQEPQPAADRLWPQRWFVLSLPLVPLLVVLLEPLTSLWSPILLWKLWRLMGSLGLGLV